MFRLLLFSPRAIVLSLLLTCLTGPQTVVARETRVTATTGLSVSVDGGSGRYDVIASDPAWTFGGTLGTPLKKVKTSRGRDGGGEFRQITFAWTAGAQRMRGQIRLYDSNPVALFSQTCEAATETPPVAFPNFTRLPAALHIFSYGHREFSPPRFSTNEICTPWMLFDDQANAFIVSPASHFMVASMFGDGVKSVASGFNPRLRNLPAGFTQQTVVALGKGINKTWDVWGRTLLALQDSKRPANDADVVLKYLGYWTDNGAAYYYHYNPEMGYAGTLQSLVKSYREEQIPIRYLQLDSWWYYKSTTDANGKPGKDKKVATLPAGEWNRYGGLLEYRAHTDLFPNGLDAFQKSVGLPLITHNRWMDPASPYHQRFEISGVAAVDPRWWDEVAAYLQTSGVVTYEQDWLDRIYTYSPAFSSNLLAGENFLDNMARACKERGVTLQYCMPYACHFLQGSRYENLTTIRTSGDRFNPNKWNDFLYTSRLAASMGIWPWADVYMSAETNNVLLSTLSAGPVGTGDLMGAEHRENLLQAVRADGVIVKPDVSILPLDRSYIADATKTPSPLTASTYTDCDGIKTGYVFAFNRGKAPAGQVDFTLGEIGVNGSAYVYDYFSGTATRVGERAPFSAPLKQESSAFYIIAPVGKSGIAFLGDKDKFVGTGKQRIESMRDETGRLTVGVVMAANEKSVQLHGYSAIAPRATVLAGDENPVQYDAATGHFVVSIKSDATTPADSTSGDPVRKVTVILDTQTPLASGNR